MTREDIRIHEATCRSNGNVFQVTWNTGDKETCYGSQDLYDYLSEAECTISDTNVIDRNGIRVGKVIRIS